MVVLGESCCPVVGFLILIFSNTLCLFQNFVEQVEIFLKGILKLTYFVDHVNTVIETLHELALTLGGRLDKELGGRHKLARLHRQLFLGVQELVLVPAMRGLAPRHAEGARIMQVAGHVTHHLLRFSEDEHSTRLFQSVVVVAW